MRGTQGTHQPREQAPCVWGGLPPPRLSTLLGGGRRKGKEKRPFRTKEQTHFGIGISRVSWATWKPNLRCVRPALRRQ